MPNLTDEQKALVDLINQIKINTTDHPHELYRKN